MTIIEARDGYELLSLAGASEVVKSPIIAWRVSINYDGEVAILPLALGLDEVAYADGQRAIALPDGRILAGTGRFYRSAAGWSRSVRKVPAVDEWNEAGLPVSGKA